MFDEFFDHFIQLFYFAYHDRNALLVVSCPGDKILFCLFERSNSEIIYDNFTVSHTIAQKASSDHT